MSLSARFLLLLVGLIALGLTGCGDTHVSLERERIALGKEMNSALSSAKNFNEMLDKAPQVESIATRLDKLAERRGKLQPASESEKSQIAKLREAEKAEMKQLGETMQSILSPAAVLSGGPPDMSKMQPFAAAMAHLARANMSYDPDFAAAAKMTSFGQAGGMPPSGKGGLIAFPPVGGADAP